MATPEEERIHAMWVEGQLKIGRTTVSLGIARLFSQFRENSLSDETIAAGFAVPVEDVDYNIRHFEEGRKICTEAARLVTIWINKNGSSTLFEWLSW